MVGDDWMIPPEQRKVPQPEFTVLCDCCGCKIRVSAKNPNIVCPRCDAILEMDIRGDTYARQHGKFCKYGKMETR